MRQPNYSTILEFSQVHSFEPFFFFFLFNLHSRNVEKSVDNLFSRRHRRLKLGRASRPPRLYVPPNKRRANHKAKHPKRKKCRSRSLLHSPKLIFRYRRCS